MCTKLTRCRMIRKDRYCHRLFPFLQGFINRADYPFVQILDGLLLQGKIPFMSCFITGLDMQVNEIIRLQCFKRFRHFVLIIGIIKSRRSFYIDASESCIYPDSIDQIHRRDNRTFTDSRIHDRQWLHGRSITRTPWPNAIGRILAFCYSFQIDGMVGQQLLGFENQVIQQFC